MIKQDDNSFDLQIRSMLEGAEENVPAEVWEGVSAALGMRRRAVMFRRWGAVAGFAAAAALVVGVFLFREPAPSAQAVLLADEGDAPVVSVVADEDIPGLMAVVPGEDHSDLMADVPGEDDATAESTGVSTLQKNGTILAKKADFVSTVPENGTILTVDGDSSSLSADLSGTETASSDETTQAREAEQPSTPQESARQASATQESAPQEPSFDLTDPGSDLQDGTRPGKAPKRLLALNAGGLMETNGSPARSAFTGRRAIGAMAPETGVREHGDNGSYGVPFSVGLGLQWHFAPRWALGAGLSYSCLSRSFTGTYTEVEGDAITFQLTSNIDNSLHYLGIPVQLSYSLTGESPIQCYAFAGAGVEKGLVNRFRINDAGNDIIYKESVNGVQVSLSLGLGVRFPLSDRVGLYLDPSLHYYPDCGQPRSIRTSQPLMFSLEAGLRFDL